MEKILLTVLFCMIMGSCKTHHQDANSSNGDNLSDNFIAPDTLHFQSPYSLADSINGYIVALDKRYPENKDTLNNILVYLNKAIEIDSISIVSYLNKMVVFSSLKDRQSVINEANIILNFNSDNIAVNINAYLNIGNAYQKLGKVDSANVAYDKAKKLIINEMKTDDDLNYQITLFRILSIQKGKNGAQYYFSKVLDSSQRTDYVKRFIDTFNVKDYLSHF